MSPTVAVALEPSLGFQKPSLGKLYDAIVNVTTTNSLIDQGYLLAYRIFSCVEPDMQPRPAPPLRRHSPRALIRATTFQGWSWQKPRISGINR